MNIASNKSSSAGKVRRYRERMRARGMRCVQLWVPDTRSEEFIRQARKVAKAIASSPKEAEDQAFVDAISEFDGQ